ncbi:hypothetical protein ABK040_010401 [Willaertia magna]
MSQQQSSSNATTISTTGSSSTAEVANEKTTLNIRLLDGTPLQVRLPADTKLSFVQKYVCKRAQDLNKHKEPYGKNYLKENGIEFQSNYPKITFHYEDFPTTTLRDIGMVPSGALNVIIANDENKELKRGKGTITDAKMGDINTLPHHVKGDSYEKKKEFKEKKRLEEEELKKKEVEEKKKELERLRKQIEGDKEVRKDIDWVKLATTTSSSSSTNNGNDNVKKL